MNINNNNNNNNNIINKKTYFITLLKLKIKYKFSITIVKKDFLVVRWFSTEQCKQLSIS